MAEPHDGCMQRAGRTKTASGMTVYLMEELGDARLNCAQLTHYIDLARQIIEKSPEKDHIFEVAGHLLQAIPEHLFKLEKSLQAVALAADRLDYEEIKQDLKPDKVEELERVLRDVRIRTVPHRSEPMRPMMNPMQAAEDLQKIATEIRTTGKIPTQSVLDLVVALEGQDRTASEVSTTADLFEAMSKALVKPASDSPKRLHLAATLRKVIADNLTATVDQDLRRAWMVGAKEAQSESHALDAAESARMAKASQAILDKKINELAQVVLAGKTEPEPLGPPIGLFSGISDALWEFVYLTAKAKHRAWAASKEASGLPITPEEQEARRSRFEKGQPADPMENMAPDDKAKWKQKNDEHGDKFKGDAKSASDWKVGGVPDQHQLKILKDTVRNPLKGKFLGGPSAEEAEEILREKFHFTDAQIEKLKKS